MKAIQARKNVRHALGISIVLAGGWVMPAFAMTPTPPMMSVQVSPRSAITGLGSTSQDGVGVNLSTRYSKRSDRQKGTDKVENPGNEETKSSQTTLLLDYLVTDGLTAILSIPYISQTASYGNVKQTTKGLGDVAVYGKYSVSKPDASSEILVLLGVELPTGSTDERDSTGVFPITQQPGSDSTDLILGAAAVWGFPTYTTYGDFSYKINGSESYTFGNFLALNAGINYPLSSMDQFSLVGEVNVEVAEQDESDPAPPVLPNGGDVPNTGYQKVFFTPGIQWQSGKNSSFIFNAQVPVYQNLKGTQLASEVSYTLGVSLRF